MRAEGGGVTLTQIREDLGECTRCKLHSTRRKIVFGVGAEDSPLMFVGEAPGEQEDKRGEPFVGPAGELLDRMIEAMGWTRQTVYLANAIMCQPPGNRNPQIDELMQCLSFLDAQIQTVRPKIIVTLGRPATNHVLCNDTPLSALRGRFHDRAGVKVMPTFHPAYLLREPDRKKDTWSDLKQVIAELERIGIRPPVKRIVGFKILAIHSDGSESLAVYDNVNDGKTYEFGDIGVWIARLSEPGSKFGDVPERTVRDAPGGVPF